MGFGRTERIVNERLINERLVRLVNESRLVDTETQTGGSLDEIGRVEVIFERTADRVEHAPHLPLGAERWGKSETCAPASQLCEGRSWRAYAVSVLGCSAP